MATMLNDGYGMREYALNDMVFDCITWNHGNAYHQHDGMFDALLEHAMTDAYATMYVCGYANGYVETSTDGLAWVDDDVNIAFACLYKDGAYHSRLLKQEKRTRR